MTRNVTFGLVVNPRDGQPFLCRADLHDRNVTIHRLNQEQPPSAGSLHREGEGYFEPEGGSYEYARSSKITGFPRVHCPQGVRHKKTGTGTSLYTAMCLAAAMDDDGELKFRPLSAKGQGISSNEDRSADAEAWWSAARERFGLVKRMTETLEGEPDDEERDFDIEVDLDHTAADTRARITQRLLDEYDFDEGAFEGETLSVEGRYRNLLRSAIHEHFDEHFDDHVIDYNLINSEILASGTYRQGTITLTSAVVRFQGSAIVETNNGTRIEYADAYPYVNALKKHLVILRSVQSDIGGFAAFDINNCEVVSPHALASVNFAGADEWNTFHVGARLIELAKIAGVPKRATDGMEVRLLSRSDPSAYPSHWSAFYDPRTPRDNPARRPHGISRRVVEAELATVATRRRALGWDAFRVVTPPRPRTPPRRFLPRLELPPTRRRR